MLRIRSWVYHSADTLNMWFVSLVLEFCILGSKDDGEKNDVGGFTWWAVLAVLIVLRWNGLFTHRDHAEIKDRDGRWNSLPALPRRTDPVRR